MMSETDDSDERGGSLPFHAERVDGELVVGVLYIGNTGEFYEFVDPDTHDKYAVWENPRTGEEMVYKHKVDASVKATMGGHIRATIPADEWDEFREDYLNASGGEIGEWKEFATPGDALRGLAVDVRE